MSTKENSIAGNITLLSVDKDGRKHMKNRSALAKHPYWHHENPDGL